jgi:phosphoglycerate dehydrogenase-like enzyme
VITVCAADNATAERLAGTPGVEVVVWDGGPGDAAALAQVEVLLANVGVRLTPSEAVKALPNLRVVLVVSAGLGPWGPALADGTVPASITVCNGRGVHTSATAEMAVAGLMATVRGLPTFWEQQRRHEWTRHDFTGLENRRALIVGAGEIGTRIAAAVELFDGAATLVARSARAGVHSSAELAGLIGGHDIAVIAVPHTRETERLVDARFLAAMPDGGILVNVARGSIVDTAALLDELTRHRLHAVLDVTDPEPLPAEHPLWAAPNLILTPHVAGLSAGWQDRAFGLVREQLRRLAAGEPLLNRTMKDY